MKVWLPGGLGRKWANPGAWFGLATSLALTALARCDVKSNKYVSGLSFLGEFCHHQCQRRRDGNEVDTLGPIGDTDTA